MVQERTADGAWRGQVASAIVAPSRAELAFGASVALDFAEGRTAGHGQRMAYMSVQLARATHRPAAEVASVYYGALLHHVGVPLVSAGLVPEDTPTTSHAGVVAFTGADAAQHLALPGAAITAIASAAERWDGTGGPAGLGDEEIPFVGRILALAELAESAVASNPNPLKARTAAPTACFHAAGSVVDPALVVSLIALMRQDTFWLGLSEVDPADLIELAGLTATEREGAQRSSGESFGRAFASIIDAKAGYNPGHSARVAGYARTFGKALGLADEECEALWYAALWHDIGVLGIPHRIIAKPDLLSIEEMDHVRAHPAFSRDVFEVTPGLEPFSDWVAAHHERIDGKGYPDGISAGDVPVQSQILAIIDTYDALTSDRPYRRAMSPADALGVLWSQAGAQFDRDLIGVFETIVDR